MENFDTTAFINMVDSFYNNAFNNLIIFGGLFVIIVTIVMPIVLQLLSRRYQSGEYDKMEINLKKEFTQIIETKTKSMEENNKKIIKDELIPLEKKLHYSIGINFHNIGVSMQKEKRITEAIKSYIRGSYEYLDADEELDLKILLDNIEKCYSNMVLTSENFFEFKNQKEEIEKLISDIENKYGKRKYYYEIEKIRKAIFKRLPKNNKSNE